MLQAGAWWAGESRGSVGAGGGSNAKGRARGSTFSAPGTPMPRVYKPGVRAELKTLLLPRAPAAGGLPNGQPPRRPGRPREPRGGGSGPPWWLAGPPHPPIRGPLPRGLRKVGLEGRQLSLRPDARCPRSHSQPRATGFLSLPCLELLHGAPVPSAWKSNLLRLPGPFPSDPIPFVFVPPPATCRHRVVTRSEPPKVTNRDVKETGRPRRRDPPSSRGRLRADAPSSGEPSSCAPCEPLPLRHRGTLSVGHGTRPPVPCPKSSPRVCVDQTVSFLSTTSVSFFSFSQHRDRRTVGRSVANSLWVNIRNRPLKHR